MRLWSIHPSYLDSAGLVALWRESLLAKKVLEGRTGGYSRHPQLERFKAQNNPVGAINSYLKAVLDEACTRKYCFDASKVGPEKMSGKIPVTMGQLLYEMEMLRQKLKKRDPAKFKDIGDVREPKSHPLFSVRSGPVESWERTAGTG